ncbi:hypothetical protein FRC17_000485 [Serendipita sp. 399]|nr:hypothetical protein FRC17_000485 [Serendipita sp. 399]
MTQGNWKDLLRIIVQGIWATRTGAYAVAERALTDLLTLGFAARIADGRISSESMKAFDQRLVSVVSSAAILLRDKSVTAEMAERVFSQALNGLPAAYLAGTSAGVLIDIFKCFYEGFGPEELFSRIFSRVCKGSIVFVVHLLGALLGNAIFPGLGVYAGSICAFAVGHLLDKVFT